MWQGWRWILCVMLMGMLTACGGENAPNAAASTDQRRTVPVPGTVPTYRVDLSGAVEVSLPPGQVDIIRQPATAAAPEHLRMSFQREDADMYIAVTLDFPVEMSAGTYDLSGGLFGRSEGNHIARVYVAQTESQRQLDFNANIRGTLTVDEAEAVYSGRFEFTAEAFGATTESLQVGGTFTNLPAAP